MKARLRSRLTTTLSGLAAVSALSGLVAIAPASPVAAAPYTSCPTGLTGYENFLSQLGTNTQISSYLNSLRTSYGLSSGPLVFYKNESLHKSRYYPASKAMEIRSCEQRTTLAHEYGHYVGHRAAGFNATNFNKLALRFTAYPNWLKDSDLSGHERLAHCVGYLVAPGGSYTKCPNTGAQALAREIVTYARMN